MDLKQLNLVELDSKELTLFEGGSVVKWPFWVTVATEILSNWDAIKAGASDGWNGTYNNRF